MSAGIVVVNNNILCFKKGLSKYSYLSNKFEFPGGKLEPNESPREALIREYKEELGVDISNMTIQYIGAYDYEYPDFIVNIYAFIIQTENFEFVLNEHEKAIWSSIENINMLEWADADKKIITVLKKELND